MKQSASKATANSEGFLLLNSSLNPIFFNRAAAEILGYPHKVEAHKDLDNYLASRVRTNLVSGESSRAPNLVSDFQSGRRLYQCRTYRVNALAQGAARCTVATILERSSNGSIAIEQISEKFHLSTREREVLPHLLN